MTKITLEDVYQKLKENTAPLLINNPSFYLELNRLFNSFSNCNYSIDNNGRTIVFYEYQTNCKTSDHHYSYLRTATMRTYSGDLDINDSQSKIIIPFNSPSDQLIHLSYLQQTFSKKGLEIERASLDTKMNGHDSPSTLSLYHKMYNLLTSYTPYFGVNTLPTCDNTVDFQRTNRYLFVRDPSNLAVVHSLSHICKEQIDSKFDIPCTSPTDQERIKKERDEFMHQSGSIQTVDNGLTIENNHLLIGTYPYLLDFFKEFILNEDDLNNRRYGAKYFLSKLESSSIKQLDSNLYHSLEELGQQQLKEEEKKR